MKKNENYTPAEIKNVTIKDEFVGQYVDLVRNVMLPYQWEVLNDRLPDIEPSHAIQNFRIAAGMEEGTFYGEVFQDSDLYKWMEAAAYSLAGFPDDELNKIVDDMVELIGKAQMENGYLNTYFSLERQERIWKNLYECHEMYCIGHMIEAAVAHYEATDKRSFLDIACKCADYVESCFGNEQEKLQGYPGHQEIELALIRLYEVTENDKYLNLGCYFLKERGKEPNYFQIEWETTRNRCTFKTETEVPEPDLKYDQSHLSVYEQKEAVGHSVRAMYMYSAMADAARITGDSAMYQACRTLWDNVCQKQMYITGAIGSTHIGEAFTFDYDLPNETAYAETCASIGLIFFAHRMLKMEIDGVYADVIEKALYNVILASMSMDGKQFFYVNPLKIWPQANEQNPDRIHVKPVRQSWYGCACCPPNIARLLTSLGKYVYSVDEETIYVHLYISGTASLAWNNGTVEITQNSNYPWNGNIQMKVCAQKNVNLALHIPSWCHNWSVRINGEETACSMEKGYVYLMNLAPDTEIQLTLPMEARLVMANPKVRSDAGKVAIQRGPILYCLEEADNGENLSALRIDPKEPLIFENSLDESGLGMAIFAKGYRQREDVWEKELYRTYENLESEVELRAVPYYQWGNRGKGEMSVWVRV